MTRDRTQIWWLEVLLPGQYILLKGAVKMTSNQLSILKERCLGDQAGGTISSGLCLLRARGTDSILRSPRGESLAPSPALGMYLL